MKFDRLRDKIINETVSGDIKMILNSLRNRYMDIIMKISYHCACIRHSKEITLADMQYAFNLIDEMFETQKDWLSNNILDNPKDQKLNSLMQAEVINILAKDYANKMTFGMLMVKLTKKFNMEMPLIRNKLINMSKGMAKIIDIDDIKDINSKVKVAMD